LEDLTKVQLPAEWLRVLIRFSTEKQEPSAGRGRSVACLKGASTEQLEINSEQRFHEGKVSDEMLRTEGNS
jgi:hypothetical protein